MEQPPDYERLYREEQRRREEEQGKREAAENAQREEQRRREIAENRTRRTTLPEFLDACHSHLHLGLSIQSDATQSTRGDPAKANNKLRPNKLVAWGDFPQQQAAVWANIMNSDFPSERYFTSLHTLEESGRAIQGRMMGSELDLNHFQRFTVEDRVSSIIEQLYNKPALRQKFKLRGSVKFENHANTLSPESQLEDGMEQMTVSGPRRRSPRLQAKAKEKEARSNSASARTTRSSHPRADQFCVYNTGTQSSENRVAAFVIEYKAPHKLPLGYIYEGLADMELDDVVRASDADTPRDQYRRLIAAVITQAFSYMVEGGLEYGCVCTGEASIFLRVPDHEPGTVQYYLSVPKGDVGASTEWIPESDRANRLYLTAVAQMLAFTLQALTRPQPRNQNWRASAAAQLNSWEIVYDELLGTIPPDDAPSSDYQPPRQDDFLRMSPIQLRRRGPPISSSSCRQPADDRGASDEEPDQDTPSRQRATPQSMTHAQTTSRASSSRTASRQEAQGGQYCTQKCLLGLVNGGALDTLCPNVRDHGKGYHQISAPKFLTLIRQQLSRDLDTDCKPVGLPGACGVLFRVRLRSHGYTVAAKTTPVHFVQRLQWEASIYNQLRPVQGRHVPVHLGNIDLETHYFYEGITKLVYMMFLSFGGTRISKHLTAHNSTVIAQQVDCAALAIHNLGILHRDLEPRNILWNGERHQVMIIDFERAEIVKPRSLLGPISANRKRNRTHDTSMVKQCEDGTLFARERRRAAIELRALT
ncbi:hypothetical protein P154DRAFT_562456 [Amniculicola lignicola CBS 123094]|uniref:Protein kinase domain-containing protein n=1 Tax=Amniculicola lignicola CBS 123094 TaxID=1392246 RepID=A0A6A5WRN0_9PLEO|nr:hypothetical protein P154DRAFT_562456 [Amniculicola lignicola CBS 123094]